MPSTDQLGVPPYTTCGGNHPRTVDTPRGVMFQFLASDGKITDSETGDGVNAGS